jgi:mono/diheme cytochrome c family protein
VTLGRSLYQAQCARCHGKNLEGQPDWQTRLPTGRLPAPPHDASGHTWHHPDGVLIGITKNGLKPYAGESYESDMPAFAGILNDEEIKAVLAFIKSTWPERERKYQERMSGQTSGD